MDFLSSLSSRDRVSCIAKPCSDNIILKANQHIKVIYLGVAKVF